MREARLTDRQRIVKLFVVGTVGLAVLFGSSPVSVAQRATICGCTCWYSGASGKVASEEVTFTTDRSCSIHNGQTWDCKDNAGALHKGSLAACKNITPAIQGESPPPGPGGVRPPVAPGQPPIKQ